MAIIRPSFLKAPEGRFANEFVDSAKGQVSLRLHGEDAMYWNNDTHYLSVGASALNVIRSAEYLSGSSIPRSILDFGAGAGRVTRWLCAGYPSSALTVADIRPNDLEFCSTTFGASVWNSGTNIDVMEAPARYDLIWVGSVMTHLSEHDALLLLKKLLSWTTKGGLFIVSFHGASAYRARHKIKYIEESLLPAIEAGYEARGFGYHDYRGQERYGVSFCHPSWIIKAIRELGESRLIAISERAWDGHHDILALQAI